MRLSYLHGSGGRHINIHQVLDRNNQLTPLPVERLNQYFYAKMIRVLCFLISYAVRQGQIG